MRLSWQYVAGFFDGEGHVGMVRQKKCGEGHYSNGSIRASMVQSRERGRILLEAVSKFLSNYGIKSTVGVHHPGDERCSRSYHLRMTGYRSVIPFLQQCMPFIWIKKSEAEDLIRFYRAFPSLRGKGHSHSDNVRKAWVTRRRLYGEKGKKVDSKSE